MLLLPSFFKELSGVVVLQGFWRDGHCRGKELSIEVCTSLLYLPCVCMSWLRELPACSDISCVQDIPSARASRAGLVHAQAVLSVSLSFVKLDPMEEVWRMLCSIFSPAVLREQWLRWCCIVRLMIRKINVERIGIIVKLEIWSQDFWLCPWSCQYRSTNYEPK